MSTQEELATLFARNLHLDNNYVAPQPEAAPAPAPAPVEEPYVYSISQHYHHSAHVVPQQQPARPASEPPRTDQLTTEIILARHGVDVSTLFPSQLDLFKTADAGQQMRLVELWRICPPDYGGHALTQDHWPATSFQQEESMAKLRYERQMLEERASRTNGDQSMDSDTMSETSNSPLTPIQGGDGRWANVPSCAEPYMMSGYEALAQREYEQSALAAGPSKDVYSHFGTSGPQYNPSTDPVYNQESHHCPNGGDWAQRMAMENQYGAFEQQQYQHNGGPVVSGYGEDEEML
ncbi:hypothetical protein HYALB_00003130 [Hymenoscyphus albidus]|uniref:Uncharacterized protein n=1 Tax=Hymenoscyphus albidus TaxID=595503 RepID=A0A9N9LFI0_9HELO|nr:hypothetical protein HYALB_00003130 [Hymenoscyphus albidus]